MWSTLKTFSQGCRRALHDPLQELNRWQRAARLMVDLARYGTRQLQHDRAPQMAAALAFRTLFGLAPILVVTTILIKSIKGSDEILATVRALLVGAGLDKLQVAAVADGAESTLQATPVTLASWLEDLTRQLVSVDMSAAGLVGFLVIIYAAIGLIVTIETSFNQIYQAPDGRSWAKRVPLYWFLLTFSPILIGLTSYANQWFGDWIETLGTWQVILSVAKYCWSFGIAWLFIMAIYVLVPNIQVHFQSALIGSFIATLLLSLGKRTLGIYLGNAFSNNQLYGSLGLVPLFMFWVYLMWLGLLLGLEVSAIHQRLQGRSLQDIYPSRKTPPGVADPTTVLVLVEIVATHFVEGQTVTIEKLAQQIALPMSTVKFMVNRLVHEGWLHRVEHAPDSVSLARPLDQMSAQAFLDLGYEWAGGSNKRASALARQLHEAQQKAAEGITIDMLVSRLRVAS